MVVTGVAGSRQHHSRGDLDGPHRMSRGKLCRSTISIAVSSVIVNQRGPKILRRNRMTMLMRRCWMIMREVRWSCRGHTSEKKIVGLFFLRAWKKKLVHTFLVEAPERGLYVYLFSRWTRKSKKSPPLTFFLSISDHFGGCEFNFVPLLDKKKLDAAARYSSVNRKRESVRE